MVFWEDFVGFLMDFGRIFGRVLMAFEVDFDRFLGGTGFVHFVLWTELNTSGFRGDFFGPWYFLEFQQIYIGLGTMRTIEWEYFFQMRGMGSVHLIMRPFPWLYGIHWYLIFKA